MKELSIEEKAKAYDELKVKASRIYNKENDVLIMHTIEDLFPEFRESEDEKIRKRLISYFKSQVEAYKDGNPEVLCTYNKWISWLEKQGTDISLFPKEQQVFMQKYISLDKVTLIKLLTERDVNNTEIIESFEKQGEQKPDENKGMNLDEEEMTPFQKKVFCIIDTTIEEEQGLKQVCDELLRLASNEIKQNSTEWSEEDERKIGDIRDAITLDDELEESYKEELYDFLKSLKPQNTWKPSDEQMEYLHKYAEQNNYDGAVLTDLYNNLRKLKQL